ncbi:MAG: AMP-binding protein [Parasulfuritortus sp.]|nr:AMP-binding protein [Parasulfuritortus sp.]
MKLNLTSVLRWAVVVVVVIAYPLIAHYSTIPRVASETPMLGLFTSLAPTLAFLIWLAWHASKRTVMLALCAILLGVLVHYRGTLAQHFDWIYLIQHAGTNILMAVAFGITLLHDRQPLCTRFAQSVRGRLTPDVIRYTRQLTLVWTLFFVSISTLSCLLFLFAPIRVWSIFANFLTFPLVILMFVVEYQVRLRKIPDEKAHGILKSVMAYWTSGSAGTQVDSPSEQEFLPLVSHPSPDSIMAYRNARPVTVRHFLGEVQHLARHLPDGQHVLNMCTDRYHFTVGLAACIVTGRISLLPSTHTPEMVRQMKCVAPDIFCITDQADSPIDLPTFQYPEYIDDADAILPVPRIASDQLIAQVFTSGSTGLPVPHAKHWGSLVRSAQAEAEHLGVVPDYALVGTVPAQHMYGLESTVLLPLQNGAAFHAGRPFYPADIGAALAELPRPRALITTPYHLRALLNAELEPPGVDLLLSATAPLVDELAREAESHLDAPLYEIYGCTETGQLASRRTTAGQEWQLLTGVSLQQEADRTWAQGGHVEEKTFLSDAIELVGADRFRLHGRNSDLVNIAGKRTSLGYLNHQLLAIPGVKDGVFIVPEVDQPDGVGRLTALVVAPGMSPEELMQALRQRIDPIFLPRPLLFVNELPRNATGKLPGKVTQELLASIMARECASA